MKWDLKTAFLYHYKCIYMYIRGTGIWGACDINSRLCLVFGRVTDGETWAQMINLHIVVCSSICFCYCEEHHTSMI
jgi:hypothetical protein